jgi:hypothetical protein
VYGLEERKTTACEVVECRAANGPLKERGENNGPLIAAVKDDPSLAVRRYGAYGRQC